MLLREILPILDGIAPLRHAESWDNVGLIVGDPAAEVGRVMLTIDFTREVADEAAREGASLVVAYHPPLFQAIKAVTAGSLIYRAIRDGVALYSPHTAFDAAEGGTNDLLGDVLGMVTRGPLKVGAPREGKCKLVTFVPEGDVERVAAALFEAGAGVIGNYTRCSFRGEGTGTFFGEEGASPAVGEAGKLEKVAEIKLEMVVPLARREAVVAALRGAHPYEEPAFDLLRLVAEPEGFGQGRLGELARPTERRDLILRVKEGLGVKGVLVAGPLEGAVSRVAVCAGAGRGLLDDALGRRAELFLTGELPHHDALRAAAAGMTVVCALHSNSERAALGRMRDRLSKEAPGLAVTISEADRDPFELV